MKEITSSLLNNFDRIAEAPDSVPRLRRFILDLAVRGKLVEQDMNDEPVSNLLKRIQAAKERLVKAREIRKPKPLPAVNEAPFALPQNWRWTRMREITSDRGQKVPDGPFTYIDVTAIDKEAGVVAGPKVLEANEAPSRARKVTKKGDVIYSCVRPYLLNVAVIEDDFDPEPIASTAFAILNGHSLVLPRYLWIVLRSPFMVACVEENQRGQAYPAINDADFKILPVPLPPLAEQHRIVAKVDELMALCDRLEAAQNKREQRRDRLAAASLNRINQPASSADGETATAFREHARFHLAHLPRLTTRPEHIKVLRQTILNLAVRGRLIPQDSSDEPARLSSKILEPLPDGLPGSWRYSRLEHLLAENTRNGYSRKPDDALNGVPILRISAGTVRNDGIVAEEEHKLISGIDDVTRVKFGLMPSDLLACRFNGNKSFVGRLTLFRNYLGIDPIYPDKLIRVRVNRALALPAYMRLAGGSDLVRRALEDSCATTVGNWGISASNLKEVPFPLPPLAEQHRIVAKVDELMAVCNQLEAQLTTTQTDSRRLLEAVLHEALPPAMEEVA